MCVKKGKIKQEWDFKKKGTLCQKFVFSEVAKSGR